MPKYINEQPQISEEIIYDKIVDSDRYVYVKKYEFTGKPRIHMLPHFHNAVEFCIVEKGAYTANIEGGERVLQAGDMVFVTSLCPHFLGLLARW